MLSIRERSRLIHEFMRYKTKNVLRVENDSTYTRVYIGYFFIYTILLTDTQMNEAKLGLCIREYRGKGVDFYMSLCVVKEKIEE